MSKDLRALSLAAIGRACYFEPMVTKMKVKMGIKVKMGNSQNARKKALK